MGENVKLKTKDEEKPSSFLLPPALSPRGFTQAGVQLFRR